MACLFATLPPVAEFGPKVVLFEEAVLAHTCIDVRQQTMTVPATFDIPTVVRRA
jgi:hypothetical protein